MEPDEIKCDAMVRIYHLQLKIQLKRRPEMNKWTNNKREQKFAAKTDAFTVQREYEFNLVWVTILLLAEICFLYTDAHSYSFV